MSSSAETSPSLLNNLRCFRFQKKPSMTFSGNDHTNLDISSDTSPVSKTVRRRIKPIVDDSDSDDALAAAVNSILPSDSSNENSNSTDNEFAEQSKALKELMDTFPDIDAMVLQDVLLRHDWNSELATREILENLETSGKKRNQRSMPGKKKVKKRRVDMDSDDSDFERPSYDDSRVYNSDEDSDIELSDELTGDRKHVFEFLQTATANELRLMPSCSQKKVDIIMSLRPFKGWIDLVEKIQANKHLSTDLLNGAQQVLVTRNNVQQLMRKCTSLAQQMERAVAACLAGAGGVKSQPSLISSSLKLTNYQMVGLNWLAVMHGQGVNGILADEMGLGKTIQVIAFLAHLKETGLARGTHLVVVPSSTLDNWRSEFERWAPAMDVFVYYGSTEERRMVRIGWARGGLRNTDVVLTTYSMVASSPEERKMFRVTQMHYVVFDEAHMLKNMNTQRYENLIRIKASNRILLTGTPLQNNLLELMSLLIFVMPTMFAGKTDDLKSLFQKNGRAMSGAAANEQSEDQLPAFERNQIAQAKRIMKPFVLRRLKRDVLRELPPKTDQMIPVALHSDQKLKYEQLIKSLQDANGQLCTSAEYSGMAMMTDLRKLSNHPLLLRYYYTYDKLPEMAARLAADPSYKETRQDYIIEDLSCMSDFEIHQLSCDYKCISKYRLSDELILKSGKFQYLDRRLDELKRNGHRVLIFSQFVIMLNVMEEYLRIRDHTYLRLDGQTPVSTRQDLIDEYTTDPSIFIFLLSTKAGGLGINLTAADTVIIHDIDFNPYNDKQAEDRCHRMGQTKPVTIERLISKGTIEEAMYQVAQEKLKLEREITTDENDNTEAKSVARLLTLAFGIDSNRAANIVAQSPSPKKQPNRKVFLRLDIEEMEVPKEYLMQHYLTYVPNPSDDDSDYDDVALLEAHDNDTPTRKQKEANRKTIRENERKQKALKYFNNKTDSIFNLKGLEFDEYTHKVIRMSIKPREFRDFPGLVTKEFLCDRNYRIKLKYTSRFQRWVLKTIEVPCKDELIELFRTNVYDRNLKDIILGIYYILEQHIKKLITHRKKRKELFLSGKDITLTEDEERLFLTEGEIEMKRRKREQFQERMKLPEKYQIDNLNRISRHKKRRTNMNIPSEELITDTDMEVFRISDNENIN